MGDLKTRKPTQVWLRLPRGPPPPWRPGWLSPVDREGPQRYSRDLKSSPRGLHPGPSHSGNPPPLSRSTSTNLNAHPRHTGWANSRRNRRPRRRERYPRAGGSMPRWFNWKRLTGPAVAEVVLAAATPFISDRGVLGKASTGEGVVKPVSRRTQVPFKADGAGNDALSGDGWRREQEEPARGGRREGAGRWWPGPTPRRSSPWGAATPGARAPRASRA